MIKKCCFKSRIIKVLQNSLLTTSKTNDGHGFEQEKIRKIETCKHESLRLL